MLRFIFAEFIGTEDLSSLMADSMDTVQDTSPALSGDIGASLMKMLLSFVLLIFLLYASYWVIKRLIQHRLDKGSVHSSIHILEKKMLSTKTTLYLVEVDHKKVLLAESHLEIRKLETLPLID